MQKPVAILCLSLLTACTSQYGNYASTSDSYNTQMADDSVRELTMLYPPATTHLALLQSAKDAYGVELVKSLRNAGYATEEGADGKSALNAANNTSVATDSNDTVPLPAATLPIHYTVDHLKEGLYRVTIRTGDQTINRVYSVTGQDMLPAGAWTRKE